MYRVYLRPEEREFGIDYPTKEAAQAAASRFREAFPKFRYSVRRAPVPLSDIAEALSDMIDLADAWATCGPEGYTPDERKRRNAADRVLNRLYRRIERERPAN